MTMQPRTKITLIIVVGVVVTVSMITGYFPELVELIGKGYDVFRSFLPGVKA